MTEGIILVIRPRLGFEFDHKQVPPPRASPNLSTCSLMCGTKKVIIKNKLYGRDQKKRASHAFATCEFCCARVRARVYAGAECTPLVAAGMRTHFSPFALRLRRRRVAPFDGDKGPQRYSTSNSVVLHAHVSMRLAAALLL